MKLMSFEKQPFSLYVHIPYCVSKCPYCDFNVHVVSRIPEAEYADALVQELAVHAAAVNWRDRTLKSVFFGGGTPSIFSPSTIGAILEAAQSLFGFEEDIEITLEANPSETDSSRYRGYRSCGINRLSIGVQSFQPRLLKVLGRTHSVAETRSALEIARDCAFPSISLDLIFACPGQSLADLEADLDEALSFRLPHLSAYNLTFEEGTPFHREYRSGKIQPLSEEAEIAMADLIENKLARNGLQRYEISNYAMPGFDSRHNMNYWEGGDYLGIGAGAHSYRRGQSPHWGYRWHNEKNPGRYMSKIEESHRAVAGEEITDLKNAAAEFVFMGLRMMKGISTAEFARRFGISLDDFYPQVDDLKRDGLLEEHNGRLGLTRRGLLVANSVFVTFI
ncbi:MAG: radical SAM family heme chaperone HemW [Candidatus Binatia bacterium]